MADYLSRARDKIQSDNKSACLTDLTTSQFDNNHGVDDVFMSSPDNEAAVIKPNNLDNCDGRPESDFTNDYDVTDVPFGHPNSLDVPQPGGPLYSEVMKRSMPRANNTSAFSDLYDHIQSPDESTVATPSPKAPDEQPIATETPSMVVYSQVNKPKKRASPHSALTGNDNRCQSMDSTYEQIGSNATDTGEIDLIENDLYESSESEINRNKKGNAGIAPTIKHRGEAMYIS